MAVLIDDNGQVKKRFSATNADLARLSVAALEKVDGSSGPLGVAVFNPDASRRRGGVEISIGRADAKARHVVGSGVAAAVAEAWTGAGRGGSRTWFISASLNMRLLASCATASR